MEQVLRTQMQARYAPEPLGHFGLALPSYAHFTSPIRRYADLLVHRALVSCLQAGRRRPAADDAEKFVEIGEHISMLERRAMEAERETIDRYVAAFLADKVGQILRCRITGVQPFGFFATVEDLGGDGLVPAAILGNEYFRYDEAARALVGEETRRNLPRRPASRAEAGRGQSGVRRAPLRASRRQVRRARRESASAATACAATRKRAAARPTSGTRASAASLTAKSAGSAGAG